MSSGVKERGRGICPRTSIWPLPQPLGSDPGRGRAGAGADVTWGEWGAAEPATEVLGCGGEVGQAVHGGGGRARCRGHQHGQVWHLGQVNDACGGGEAGCSHGGGALPAGHPAGGGLRVPARTTRRCSLPGPRPGPEGPFSERQALPAPPLLPSSAVGEPAAACAPRPRPDLSLRSRHSSPVFGTPRVTGFPSWALRGLGRGRGNQKSRQPYFCCFVNPEAACARSTQPAGTLAGVHAGCPRRTPPGPTAPRPQRLREDA